MDVFDKFFRKYAYKFEKGYPDMNNEQDILLLESLLSNILGEEIKIYGYPSITEDSLTITEGIVSAFSEYGDILTSAKINLRKLCMASKLYPSFPLIPVMTTPNAGLFHSLSKWL